MGAKLPEGVGLTSGLAIAGRARCLSDVACGITFASSFMRRSRILARREAIDHPAA